VPKINFLVNAARSDAIESALQTADWLHKLGIDAKFDPDSGAIAKRASTPNDELADADLVVSFGGDGTLIRAAVLCSVTGTPILGVYHGSFGFVTQCDPSEVRTAIRQFLDGESEIDERMMLQGDLNRNGQVVATLHALNEIAVQRSIANRMMTFGIKIDWEEITSYPADGLLVATPTGSTAYNLSCGGPILDPKVQAMILTPITPHSLGARPLVLHPGTRIELSVGVQGDAIFSSDGQFRLNMINGDVVVVTRSERVTRLVEVDRSDFLLKLRTRLLWGARS
jgi:NAD+ kinase